MVMERLSVQDLMMLRLDEVGWPMDIGALAIIDGTALVDDGRFRIEAVREAIEQRLHLVPRFRQLLYTPPLGLGWPLWVDAQDFDIAEHVQLMPLAAPADEATLLLAVEQLRSRRLDRSRPLWEIWFLLGLADGRIAMFMKMHHTIADGVAGVATVGALLDRDPNAAAAKAPPWTPPPMPSKRNLLLDNVRRRVHAAREVLPKLARPIDTGRRMWRARPAISASMAIERAPKTSLSRPFGRARRLAVIRSDLEVARATAHAVKLNDVLMTAIAEGLRQLLQSRGERVQDLVLQAYVPASLHHEGRGQARGNESGMIFVPLPIGVPDPIRRLQLIAAETAELKQQIIRAPDGVFARNAIAQRAFLRLAMRRPFADIYVANVPGPPMPLYLAGARLLEVFPVVPVAGTMTIGVGALTYAGQFNITVVADHDACPDLAVFADGVRDALQTLATSRTPV
jgi:diacylglycerol O-acyltransferase / wax synthase